MSVRKPGRPPFENHKAPRHPTVLQPVHRNYGPPHHTSPPPSGDDFDKMDASGILGQAKLETQSGGVDIGSMQFDLFDEPAPYTLPGGPPQLGPRPRLRYGSSEDTNFMED